MAVDTKKEQEREELHRAIWAIADELRGAVDGWDFKNYVLGTMFYRYISENLTNYINKAQQAAGFADFDFAKISDEEAEEAREDMINVKGFFILPSELFCNVVKNASNDENLNMTLESIFNNIEGSAKGTASEGQFTGLFDDFDVNSNKLGATVAKRNERLTKLLNGIANMNLGNYRDHDIDAFGDAYEYLMSMYASNAGKSGGEFFTPAEVSVLLTRLGTVGKKSVNKVYDPACGSGSLLLKTTEVLGKDAVKIGFFGQELNITAYNLCRINMFLHDIGYDRFDIACDDTLTSPKHWDNEPFDLIVSNPPYSIPWEGNANPSLINDPIFAPAGVLAPNDKADLAFIMHSLSWLSSTGTAAIVCFPEIMYRGGSEQKIRKYLVTNNYVDTVIQLPDNLFFGTSIASCILVLKKNKLDNRVQFIDASKECVKVTNNNKLTEDNLNNIVRYFAEKGDVDYISKMVTIDEIEANDFNLSVSTYVEKEDNRIKEWAKLLLDLGKRNNLINFKDSKKTSAEIVAPDSEKVFGRAQGEASFEVYNPNLKYDEMTEMVVDDKISKEEYIRKYSERIKSDKQLLLYNPTSPIFAAKEIGKKARSAIEETGVNIAHLAFGFVHWKESDDSEYVYRAPLLLIPITLSEASKVEPIYIKTLGEDVVVNPTLSYKLSVEYGFELPEYNEQSFDEYVAAVRALVAPLKWKVTDDCKIGLFSFLKINMYYDLIKNTENIESSQIIKTLLNQEADSEGLSNDLGEEGKKENPIIELHNVIDADSSQIEAIEMAKSGKSFVLQGPPGTGKSQTITNIIAECLHDGKKILFVSEKQAALNVVFDKLKKACLEDFCLELHSYKANKKDFINNINDALSSTRRHLSRSAFTEVEKKKKLIEELDLYESELHKIRPVINESLYAMYDCFSSCRELDEETSFVIDEIEKKGKEYLEKAEDLLNTYSGFVDAIGYNYTNNPWYGYVDRDTSYRKMEEVKRKFMTLVGMISDFEDTRKDIEKDYDLQCNTINDLKSWKTFFNVASKSNFMTPTFLENAAFAYTYEKLGFLKEHGEKIVSIRDKITKNYDAEIMNIQSADYQKVLERQYSSFFSRLFSSEYKLIIKEIRLLNKRGQKEYYQGAIDLLKDINTYKQLYSEFEEKEVLVKDGFGYSYKGVDTDWAKLTADFECLKGLYAKGTSFGSISGLTKESYETNKKNFERYENSIGDFINHCEELCESVSRGFDSSLFNIYTTDLDEVIKKLSLCVDDMDGLENWIHFINLMDELKDYGIKEFVDAAITSNVPAKDVAKSFKKTFYHQWIETVIRSTPVLSRFNYVEHNKALQEFKNKDLEHFAINMAEIRSELYSQRPLTDVVPANSPIAIIKREAQKKRKQKSIRALLSETGELVQTLKPCFLMSPLSVSTFLDTDKIRFDTVVFDEASQIFPQDAIGAIYRGSQLIVVGDSKQMPPSNFFSTTIESENDEEEEINDYESILDLCSTKFTQLLLKWHYRSKYEELIAFSNRKYYKNELVTFPSSISANMMDVGIDFYKVDGVYDRTSRTNRVEAEKVVDLVFEHFKKYPQRSLGVVAFNISQQSLIEKLISKRREKDPSADEFFKGDLKEPFFVKNLETVQGDERDTIIFSVAYAKDTTGRFISNFGPLNKVGGERRLNVAVTRAKENVKLVTSIYYTDIPVSENVGAKNLRDYLDFAQNGAVALERSISVDAFDHYDSDFEMEVCEFLRSKGFTVDTQVGCSSFKIDMAIRKPDTFDYVLAVECDGASYHSSKNARDRDRLRQQVLESMGWQFYRIWSTDWFRNKENAKIKLLKAASAAVDISKKPVLEKKKNRRHLQTSPEDFECQREEHLEFPKYQLANDDSIFRRNRYSFIESLAEILKIEAPLSEEWLLKRTCKFFNMKKVTSYVTDQYEYNMRNASAYGITRQNGFLYLSGNNSYTMRIPDGDFKRDFNYIAYEELAAGMYYIIKNSVTVHKDALYLATVKVLGFAKVTDNFRQRLDKALSILSKNGVDADGDIIKIRQS